MAQLRPAGFSDDDSDIDDYAGFFDSPVNINEILKQFCKM